MAKKHSDFSLIFIGLIFIANPLYNIVDILPDFIGCLLIVRGLKSLRDFSPELSETRHNCINLAWLSAGKMFCLYLTMHLADQGYLMLFTFVFTLAEFVFMYKIINGLFEGLFFISTVYDCPSGASGYQVAKTTSIFFLFSHCILTLLPEFVYLYVVEGVGYVLAAYKGVLNVISIILSLVIGIIWIVQMKNYLGAIDGDVVFASRIGEHYRNDILTDSDMFVRRSFKTATSLFSVSSLFLCDFYIDGIDMLPDVIGVALIFYGIWHIRKYINVNNKLFASLGIYSVCSAGVWLYMKNIADEYYEYGLSKNIDGIKRLAIGLAIVLLKCVALGFAIYCITRIYNSIITDYTGRKQESEFESIRKKDAQKRKHLMLLSKLYLIFGIAVAFSVFISNICLYYFDEYWMINLLFTIGFCVINSKLCFDANYSIEEKYM